MSLPPHNDKWISLTKELPGLEDPCWLYGSFLYVFWKEEVSYTAIEKNKVFMGYRAKNHEDTSLVWLAQDPKHGILVIEEISHWMPYFTPSPPDDTQEGK